MRAAPTSSWMATTTPAGSPVACWERCVCKWMQYTVTTTLIRIISSHSFFLYLFICLFVYLFIYLFLCVCVALDSSGDPAQHSGGAVVSVGGDE